MSTTTPRAIVTIEGKVSEAGSDILFHSSMDSKEDRFLKTESAVSNFLPLFHPGAWRKYGEQFLGHPVPFLFP